MKWVRAYLPFIVFGLLAATVSAVVLSNLTSVEMRGEAGDSLVQVENHPAPSNLRLELIDSNGDGFPDSGSLQVNNRGDFELRSRIANVGVRIDYEDNSSLALYAERYDKGKWNFYLASDGDNGPSENDAKFGEVWIKYGNYYLDGDQFYVPGGGSKDLKVELKYQPYAPGKIGGVKYYAVYFDIVMLENRR